MPALPLSRAGAGASGPPGASAAAPTLERAPPPAKFREFSRTESAADRLEASAAAELASSRDSGACRVSRPAT